MKIFRLFVLLLLPAVAWAQLNRSFVSTSGSDLNTCTPAAPCRSFGAAIARTNAGGEILALDSGGYGAFTIDRSVSVIGSPGIHAAITATAGNGITVSVGEDQSVRIRGLHLTGLGGSIGIDFALGRVLEIEGVTIAKFSGAGISVDRNAADIPADVIIRDTIVRENEGGMFADGEFASSPIDLAVQRSAFTHMGAGVYLSYNATATFDDTLFAYNTNGILITADLVGASRATLERCTLAHNEVGAYAALGGAIIRISRSIVTGNDTGTQNASGGIIESFGNNVIRGNALDIGGTLTSVAPN